MQKIIFHLNCLAKGGAERVVTNLSHQFANHGYDVIIATEWIADLEYELQENVRRIHVGLRESDECKNRMIQYILRIKYLRELIKREQPDIVISFMKKANYRAMMATTFMRVATIFSVRMDPYVGYTSIIDRIFTKLFLTRANGCVFQTSMQQAFFSHKIQKKSRIILNPINEKYIGIQEPILRNTEIVHVGRVADFKNQIGILKAFHEIHKSYPEYILKFYGEDSQDGTLEKLTEYIVLNQLEEAVFIMGDSDQLQNEINQSAMFILNSNDEGMPNALMEAMALGIPCIATDCSCGGPATLINHLENGYLIPIKSHDALVEAIRYYITNKQCANKIGQEARQLGVIANGQAIYKQWEEYIAYVIKNK